ncbi:phosphotransferase family protein [Marinobacter sp. C2H3]|uniref:phosphotransferase family protein n=1 Tax=Marinobacter sp. C2H3 TaxID=3119003 RepID=UPI00300F4CC4
MAELAEALCDYLVQKTGAWHGQVLAFDRLSGGAIQDNFGLTLDLSGGSHPGERAFVVRQDAPSGVAESLGRPEEFAVLRAAFDAGVTVPEPLWLCEDTAVTGRRFYVMTRARGNASGRALAKAGWSEVRRRALVARLATELAALHRVQPSSGVLGFLPAPEDGNAAQARVALYRRYLAAINEPHPVLEWGLNWLEDHAPAPRPLVLCHGDFRTGNYLVDEGELTAVLDWEFAAWSDPLEDLGWLCSPSWRFGASEYEVGGIGHINDLLDTYFAASGQTVSPQELAYWQAMALVRWAVIALQQARRHCSGEQRSLELALTGRMVVQMEYDLLNQIDALEALV